MTIQETIHYIESRGKFGMRLGLDSIRDLLAELGNPQEHLTFIHVAGTNGKGSFCAMLSAILTQTGYTTGLYTSPALEQFNERIRLNTQPIPDDDLVSVAQEVKAAAEAMEARGLPYPTGFELETAMALVYFLMAGADFATPMISAIMPIGLDHTHYLGNTIAQIAGEKAAILKEGSTCVMAPQRAEARTVIQNKAAHMGCPVVDAQDITLTCLDNQLGGQALKAVGCPTLGDGSFALKLLGQHQQDNCRTVLAAVNALVSHGVAIPRSALTAALSTVTFTGRFEVLSQSPTLVIDGAHNPDGMATFAKNIGLYFKDRPLHLYLGMLGDKDIDTALSMVLPLAATVSTLTPDNDRAMDAQALANRITADYHRPVTVYTSVAQAVEAVKKDTDDHAVSAFVGSLYLIGHVRSAWMAHA